MEHSSYFQITCTIFFYSYIPVSLCIGLLILRISGAPAIIFSSAARQIKDQASPLSSLLYTFIKHTDPHTSSLLMMWLGPVEEVPQMERNPKEPAHGTA